MAGHSTNGHMEKKLTGARQPETEGPSMVLRLRSTSALEAIHRNVVRVLSSSARPSSEVAGPCTSAALLEDEHDVVIVGGGLVGAAVACGLATSPYTSALRTAIVDGSGFPKENASKTAAAAPDARVSAITPSTVSFFQEVGAWDAVQGARHAPFDSMQVWDYSGQGYTRYKAADVGESVLGYVVENNVLLAALRSRLQESFIAGPRFSVVRRLEPMLPKRYEEKIASNGTASTSSADARNGNWARVLLEDGRCLQTRLVVGADGGRSKVREKAGFETTGWNYGQDAVICTVRVDKEHSTAWQRFLPTGPLALLPLGEDFSNIVWSTTPERAQELKRMGSEEFVSAVNQAFSDDFGQYPRANVTEMLRSYLGSTLFTAGAPSALEQFQVPPTVTEVVSSRLSFPLSLSHSNRYVGHRVALVGDAAHTVHPLAGQGVNLGFGDAAALVDVIKDGVKLGSDIGEVTTLQTYESERMAANLPMMAVLDGFQRVFAANNGVVNVARAVGFSAVQLFAPLKRRVISFAMGFQDTLDSGK